MRPTQIEALGRPTHIFSLTLSLAFFDVSGLLWPSMAFSSTLSLAFSGLLWPALAFSDLVIVL